VFEEIVGIPVFPQPNRCCVLSKFGIEHAPSGQAALKNIAGIPGI
jgi:hypothetical protein